MKYEIYLELTDTILQELAELESLIFDEPLSLEEIKYHLQNHPECLIILARDGLKPVGFKVSYSLSADVIYSWIGGVREDYRRQGIAQTLMRIQHLEYKKIGSKIIRTKTHPFKFKAMYDLNLAAGFKVTFQDPNSLKVIMEKEL